VVCALGLLLTATYAVKYGIPVVDTLMYLDVGRNLLKGRGFVERFNLIHAWPGPAHSGMAFYNPLYGLVLGALWQLLGNPGAAGVAATALPCCVNAALIAVLVRPAMGSLTALLSAIGFLLLPTTWLSLAIITAEHPALTVVLVCLLVIQRCTLRSARSWMGVGAILGLAYFIKVGVATAVPGVIAAIVLTQPGSLAQRIRASRPLVLWLVAGIAVTVLPYLLLCKLTVGEIYPVFPVASQNWMLAAIYGGHYVADSPAVRPDVSRLPGVGERATNILLNQWDMLRALGRQLGLLVVAVIVGAFAARAEARRQAIFLLAVGASIAMGHAAIVSWQRIDPFWAARYIIYGAPLCYPVGVYGVVWLAGRLLRPGRVRGVAVVVVWGLVSLPAIVPLITQVRSVLVLKQPRVVELQRMAALYNTFAGPDDLVALDATTYDGCAAAFMDRPLVSLPFRAMDTPQSMREFVDVFHPAVVLPGQTRSGFRVLPRMGYQSRQIPQLAGATVFLRQR
jgi:hypothetical protein